MLKVREVAERGATGARAGGDTSERVALAFALDARGEGRPQEALQNMPGR